MKLALAVPIILQAALVTALDVPVYGKIKLTFATPEPTSVSLNVPHAASKRDAWGYGPFHWGGWNYPAPSNGGWPKSTAVYGGVPQSRAAATTTSVAAVTPTISQTGVVPSTYLQTTAVVSSYSASCQATETRGWWFWQYTLIYPSSCPASTTYTTVLPRTTFVTVTPSVLPASITVSSKPVSSAVAPPVYISSSASTHVTVITFSSIVTVSHNNTTATSIRRTTRTSTVIVLTTVPAYTTNARNAISSATTIDAVSSASASVSDQATNPVIPAYRIPVSDAPTRDPSASATHSEATPSAFLNSATSVLGAEASVAIGQESQTSTISTPVAYGDAKISSVRASSSQNVSHADISSSMTFPSAGLSSSSDGQTLTIISSSQASATKEVLSSPPGYRSASAYTARSVELSLTAVRSSTAAGKASSEVPLSQPTAPSGAGDTASVSVSLVSSTTVSTSASSQSNPESSSSANSLISPVGSAASIKPSSYNSKSNALPPYYVPRPSVTSSSAAVFSEASGAASSVSSSYWLASTASEISIVSTSLTIAFSYAAGPASASLASALRSGSLPASYAVPSARTTTSAAQNRSSIASGGIPSYANSVVSSAVTVSTGSIPAILPYESPPSTNSRPVSISQTEHTPTSASSSTEGGRSLTASASCMSKPSNIHTKSRTRAQHSIGRCNGSTGASSSIGASSTYVVAPATASISSAAAARSSGKAISSGSPSKSTTLSQSSLQASASISALTNAYRSASMLGTTDLPSRVYGTGQISSLITQSRSMLSGYVSTAIASSTGRSTLPSSSGVLVSPVKYSLSNAVSVSVLSKPSNIHTKSRTRAGHSIGRCNASSCSSTATGSVRQSRPFSSSGISIGPVSYSASPSRVSSSNISSVRLPSTGVTSAARSSVGSSLRPVSSSAKTSSSTSSLVSASCLSKPSNAHTKSRTRAAHSIGHCSAGSGTSTGSAISSGAIGSQGAFSSSVASSRASVSVATPSVSSSASSRQASTSQVFSQASRGTGYGVVRSSAPTAVSLASIPTSGVSISPPAYGAKYPSSAAVSDRLVSSSVGSASRPESFTASASIEPGARSSSGAPSSVSRLATSAPSIALSRPPAYPQSGSQRPSFKPSSGASGSGWPDFPSWTISATAVSSKVSSSKVKPSTSTSAYVCATPTPDAKCTPCKDQPGSDPASYCGYTINDNYYDVVPTTCRTVEYNFTITNTTLAPDGYDRPVMLINGQMPGPQIEANWGDWIVVHITNQLQDNGTSLHFHGARMNGTNEMDGATSITQCPVAPGESYTYKFRATQYGTSWYHSHFGLQAYEGVFGPMVINGPQSAEYDYDAGVLTLQDWSHVPVMAMFDAAQTVGSFPEHGPRTMDTGLINGMNKGQYGGDHFTLPSEFVPGKRYLIRLVNTAIQATFKFYIDQHKFKVIAMDYTPIHPYEATIVTINPGQRYDIIVEADQVTESYWIRADAQDTCTTNVKDSKDIKAVLNYAGAYLTEPWSTPWPYVDTCEDEKASDLVPILSLSAGALDESLSKTVVIGPGPQTPNLYKWQLDGTSFVSKWDDPTLLGIVDNRTITNKYTGNLQVQYDLGEWIYLLIQTPIPLTHPIHLHGHDFFVVGSGIGQYKQSDSLNLVNPPRRDTALIPSASGQGGYLVLAWKADNPGAWLAHCHIGWHAAMGFTLEIIEGSADEIASTVTNSCQVDDTCKAWNVYAAAKNVEDLGI